MSTLTEHKIVKHSMASLLPKKICAEKEFQQQIKVGLKSITRTKHERGYHGTTILEDP